MTSKTIELKSRENSLASSFIQKSYQLLEDQKFLNIVDWNPEGTAIVIKEPLQFAQTVLPAYFKHNNLTSFVRQLNTYDFRKRRNQFYDHIYHNGLFQRDQKHLLVQIKTKRREDSLVSIQKAIITLKAIKAGQQLETDSNLYENQALTNLNKDAFDRINVLSSRVEELTSQNQALWDQINYQNKKEDLLVSFMSGTFKNKGTIFDQLSRKLKEQVNFPTKDIIEHIEETTPQTPKETKNFKRIEKILDFNKDLSSTVVIPELLESPRGETPHRNIDKEGDLLTKRESGLNIEEFGAFGKRRNEGIKVATKKPFVSFDEIAKEGEVGDADIQGTSNDLDSLLDCDECPDEDLGFIDFNQDYTTYVKF